MSAAGGDAYVLKHIVHARDEFKVREILRNVRHAMATGTELLVIEMVIPDDDREHLSKVLELEMLVAGTGRERTAAGYAELLGKRGFRKMRVIPTACPTSVVESEAAWPISTHRHAAGRGDPRRARCRISGGRAWPEPCGPGPCEPSSWRLSSWPAPSWRLPS
ncbi:methyltransferase [Mycobacterium sp.]|uniref:methyltransferase n=1 Tax=Mycobacterium sp. TaxID=1785 RepID=UPI0039C9DB02